MSTLRPSPMHFGLQEALKKKIPKAVGLIPQLNCPGYTIWSMVRFDPPFEPVWRSKKTCEEGKRVERWIKDNCAGKVNLKQRDRIQFEHEADATLCYMMFR